MIGRRIEPLPRSRRPGFAGSYLLHLATMTVLARVPVVVSVLLLKAPRASWEDTPDDRRPGIARAGCLDGRTSRRRPGRLLEGGTHP